MAPRGTLEASILVKDDDQANANSFYKRMIFLADALEPGDQLNIAVGDRVIETIVKKSGKHTIAVLKGTA